LNGFQLNAFKKLAEFFSELSTGRKFAVIGTSVVIVVVTVGIFLWASKANYVTLASKLTNEDSTAIIRYLREKKIPFKVDQTGGEILIPHDQVYDLRLELAGKGMMQTGVVGYEIFDNQKFGTTSTVQKINQQRAIEGELVRTINHIKGIERSRVHLAIPTKSAFLEQIHKPTGSVVLDLAPGFEPTESQIRGIQNLVSSAVQDLEVESVAIISTNGRQLSQNHRDPAALFAAASLDYQRKYEADLESKIVSILTRVVGEGKVVARVTADLDFSQVSETQTLFDGDNATPRSTNKTANTMQGRRPVPGGAPGAKANVPGADGQVSQAVDESVVTNDTVLNRDVTNFEVPQTTRVSQKPMASLKRLSVAVMLDGVDVSGDARSPAAQNDWSPEKMKEFKSIAANAVGWVEGRDPPIEVRTMKFYKEDVEKATQFAAEQERNQMIIIIAGWIAIGLLFTLFFMFVVRPFIKWVTENTIDNVEDFLPQTLEELEKTQSAALPGMEDLLPEMEEKIDPVKVQGEMLKEKIISLVNENPKKAAQVIHEWVHRKPEEDPDAIADKKSSA
jgi:flagellar M-ring protein FliF